MKKPHIVKPCPEMYPPCHIECDLKLENNMNTAAADCRKHSPSVMDRIKALNLRLSSSQLRNPSIFFASVNAARMDRFVIMSIKNTSA
jgi:hypothetical protein